MSLNDFTADKLSGNLGPWVGVSDNIRNSSVGAHMKRHDWI